MPIRRVTTRDRQTTMQALGLSDPKAERAWIEISFRRSRGHPPALTSYGKRAPLLRPEAPQASQAGDVVRNRNAADGGPYSSNPTSGARAQAERRGPLPVSNPTADASARDHAHQASGGLSPEGTDAQHVSSTPRGPLRRVPRASPTGRR